MGGGAQCAGTGVVGPELPYVRRWWQRLQSGPRPRPPLRSLLTSSAAGTRYVRLRLVLCLLWPTGADWRLRPGLGPGGLVLGVVQRAPSGGANAPPRPPAPAARWPERFVMFFNKPGWDGCTVLLVLLGLVSCHLEQRECLHGSPYQF